MRKVREGDGSSLKKLINKDSFLCFLSSIRKMKVKGGEGGGPGEKPPPHPAKKKKKTAAEGQQMFLCIGGLR